MEKRKPGTEDERDITAETAIGAGIGAAGGSLAGVAIGTAVGGPLGTAVGAVLGAVTGGLAGAGLVQGVDTEAEDAYWREQHPKQPYARDRSYEDFAPAYRTGYEGHGKHKEGTHFEEAESALRQEYENWWREHSAPGAEASTGTSTAGEQKMGTPAPPSWEEAKHASKAAWLRVERGEAVRLPLPEVKESLREEDVRIEQEGKTGVEPKRSDQ